MRKPLVFSLRKPTSEKLKERRKQTLMQRYGKFISHKVMALLKGWQKLRLQIREIRKIQEGQHAFSRGGMQGEPGRGNVRLERELRGKRGAPQDMHMDHEEICVNLHQGGTWIFNRLEKGASTSPSHSSEDYVLEL